MVYIKTQKGIASIPINDNMVVCIERNGGGGGSWHDIVTDLSEKKYILGIYENQDVAKRILRNINKARAQQNNVYVDMPSRDGKA